jgi:hypothetical protein
VAAIQYHTITKRFSCDDASFAVETGVSFSYLLISLLIKCTYLV